MEGGISMIKRTLIAFTCLLASAGASADFVGLYAGAGYWGQDFGGNVISGVSAVNDLGVSGSDGNYLYVALEHPIPPVPNIRVARTMIKDTGTGMLSTNFTYQGQNFTTGQTVSSDIDLTNTDVTLYYEIIDTGVDLDLGITGRFVRGEVAVDSAQHGVSAALPMAYAHARVPMPFNTYADGNLNFVSYSGNQVSDVGVAVGWQTKSTLLPEIGVEAGYRRVSINVSQSDADVNVDMAIKGAFVNLTVHF
jgi:outer membrane protein